MSDTPSSSVSSLTRTAPRRRISSAISCWRWPASISTISNTFGQESRQVRVILRTTPVGSLTRLAAGWKASQRWFVSDRGEFRGEPAIACRCQLRRRRSMSDAERRPPAPFDDAAADPALGAGHRRRRPCRGVRPAGCGDDADDSSGGGGGGDEKASGTVSFGSNYSDPVPKKALADGLRRVHDRLGREGRRQHGRPQHVPGADQQLPPGHARRRLHAGSPATACSSSPSAGSPATSPTSGRRSAATCPTPSSRRRRARRQPVLRAVLQLPVGRLLPEERVREERLRAAANLDDFKALMTKMKADGHDADRLRRQGRLARDGHVRHTSTCAPTATTSTSA